MTNIVKHFYYLLFIIGITQNFQAQVFLNTNINLNSGAKVNDIADINAIDESEQMYLLAGDFNSINGQATNGLQFISKSTLGPISPSRFSAITNASFTQGNWSNNQITEIITVDYYRKSISDGNGGFNTLEHVYIGGTFQEVNGDLHVGFCLFKSLNNGAFTLDNWDPDFGTGSGFNVHGTIIKNDSLFISGYFYYSEAGLYDPNGLSSITAFTLPNNNPTSYGQSVIFNHYLGYNNAYTDPDVSPIKINEIDNNIIAYTSYYSFLINNYVYKLSPQGGGGGTIYNFFGANNFTDSTFLINYTYSISNPIHLGNIGTLINEFRKSDGTTLDTIYYPNAPSPFSGPKLKFYDTPHYDLVNRPRSYNMTKYKDNLYFIGVLPTVNSNSYSITNRSLWKRNIYDTLDIPFGNHTSTLQNDYITANSFIIDNKLFYTSNVDSINNTKINGLAIFCLEPMDVDSFLSFDTTVCGGQDSILYAVAPVDYASSYKWEYSGTGMIIHQSGINPLDTLYPSTSHNGTDSIYVRFGSNFTPGTLTVTALSECGIPSKPISINIISNPLPQIYAGLDTTLNCKRDTVILIGSSTTSNVSYKWNPFDLMPTIGTIDTVTNNGAYIFEVRDSIGCTNYDTVIVSIDTISPTAVNVPNPQYITCANPTLTYLGASTVQQDSVYWKLNNNYYSNPITATVPDGEYRLIVLNKLNGCTDSTQYFILNNNSTLSNIQIQGYPNIDSTLSSIETITCSNDTLNLITESSTPNTIITWTSADSTQSYGTQLQITNAGTYYIKATNTNNSCVAYKNIIIDIDTIKPLTTILPMTFTELSCSLDSLTLLGGSASGNTNSYWSGPNNYIASNGFAAITIPGTYFVNVTSIGNGCTNIDSISIEYNPNIIVSLGNDTVACNQESVLVNSSYIGNSITGLSYNWSNGTTNNSASYLAGTDSIIILELYGDNSCYGSDTIYLTIPPIPEVNINTFKPCGGGNDGQIVITPTSGWTPFDYSIDNGTTFQSSNVFNNIAFGNHTITVQDSLNCWYDFTTAINDTSNLPTPLFLVQTYNFSSDTVILIDVSSPTTDSSSWTFPVGIQVIDNNSLAPIIILPDTGSFDVTMKGYYGTCNVDITKTIYALDYDSTFANSSNANGIKSMQLYPNPNTGSFNIEIEFYKKQQAVITIQDISGSSYFNNQYGEVDLINEYISISNVINGTYILKIVSEYDSRYITFIITQ